MDYNKFNFAYRHNNNIKIERKKETYTTTKSGNFKRKPETIETEIVTPEFYENFIKSVSFFNGFCGGSCRAYWGYSMYGYIPIKVTTISPDRQTKQVDWFTFID